MTSSSSYQHSRPTHQPQLAPITAWRMISAYINTDDNKFQLVDNYDEMLLNRVSAVARQQIRDSPRGRPVLVQLSRTSKGPIREIMELARRYGRRTRVKADEYSLPKAIMLFQALESLQFDPPQPRVYGHIKYEIAHKKLEPIDVQTIDKAFPEGHKLWALMVHHLAWDFHRKKFEEDEGWNLIRELQQRSNLYDAFIDKGLEFKRRDEAKARKEAGAEAKKERERVNNIYRERRERKEAREWEEAHGLREASKKTVQNVMGRQAHYTIVDRTKKNKGKSKHAAADEEL